MTDSVTNASDHEQIESLLPWFVNQTLDKQQREVVLRHLEHCDDCRHEIEYLTALQDTVRDDAQVNYSKHANMDKNLSSVLSQIDAESGSTGSVSYFMSNVREKLRDLFQFSTALSFPQLAATAMAGLLVAVLGFQLFDRQLSSDYTVLSSPDSSDSFMRLSVEVTSTDNHQQVQSEIQYELDKISQQVVIEKNQNGVYILVFKDSIDVTDLGALVAKLENASYIKRVQILP